ncbi:metal ABC transporter solute-binding protein, Zn/Mn family [Arthrobacter sp. MMS24-S77]
MRRTAARLSLAASAGLAVLLAACAAPAATAPSSSSGVIDVVASTSVYGDIVKTVGGDKVSVTSIITKTSQDPHSYEASTQDKLAISKAQLVIDNGAGYDDFFSKLSDDSKVPADKVITAVNASGLLPAPTAGAAAKVPEGFNEHVWYNFDAMGKLADAVAAKLGSLNSAEAKTFTANADKFKSSLTGLSAKIAEIKSAKRSAPVAITEPVPGYLLDAAGLENKTPEEFSHAIEAGSDVPRGSQGNDRSDYLEVRPLPGVQRTDCGRRDGKAEGRSNHGWRSGCRLHRDTSRRQGLRHLDDGQRGQHRRCAEQVAGLGWTGS